MEKDFKESKMPWNPKTLKDSENQTDMLTLISEGKNDHVDSDKNDVEHLDSQ